MDRVGAGALLVSPRLADRAVQGGVGDSCSAGERGTVHQGGHVPDRGQVPVRVLCSRGAARVDRRRGAARVQVLVPFPSGRRPRCRRPSRRRCTCRASTGPHEDPEDVVYGVAYMGKDGAPVEICSVAEGLLGVYEWWPQHLKDVLELGQLFPEWVRPHGSKPASSRLRAGSRSSLPRSSTRGGRFLHFSASLPSRTARRSWRRWGYAGIPSTSRRRSGAGRLASTPASRGWSCRPTWRPCDVGS